MRTHRVSGSAGSKPADSRPKSPRKLSTAQAFLEIAKLWDNPTIYTDDCNEKSCYVTPRNDPRYGLVIVHGLCDCLLAFLNDGRISCLQRHRMRQAIHRNRPKNRSRKAVFFWKTNLAGARRRAALCRKLAQEFSNASRKKSEQ